jgi:hypothetical protein
MKCSRTGLPRAVLLAGTIAAFAILPAPASAAQATTYVASPAGSGEECTEAAPCEVGKAVSLARDGDTVRMLEGNYILPFSGIQVKEEINLGGAPGAVPSIETTSTATVQVTPKADANLHDIRLHGRGGLALESGSAERVYVAFTGQKDTVSEMAACELGPDTTLRDSVCWANEIGEKTSANGVEAIFSASEGLTATVVLRNVTAIASDIGGNGLAARAGFGTKVAVEGSGVIARAANAGQPDVSSTTVGAGFPETAVTLTHSNFGTVGEEQPRARATAPRSATDQTAMPLFASAAAGDFHELPGSPTIDGGLADSQTGPLDLDGNPRALPGCLGGPAVPDIGAYELTGATAACPPPPGPPVLPPEPAKPRFRIVKVTLHGPGGSIQVGTPGAGMVTLTGSGVKLITRTTSSAQTVTMPIQPWAITRVRLKKTGKTTVRLKLKFAPSGGAPQEMTKSIVLKKG